MEKKTILTRILKRISSFEGTRSLYSFKDDPAMKKLKEKQAFFQKKDGVPVYLKGGPMDLILFRATLGLMAVGTIMTLHFVIRNINK